MRVQDLSGARDVLEVTGIVVPGTRGVDELGAVVIGVVGVWTTAGTAPPEIPCLHVGTFSVSNRCRMPTSGEGMTATIYVN
jgi:hypothetical protein